MKCYSGTSVYYSKVSKRIAERSIVAREPTSGADVAADSERGQ